SPGDGFKPSGEEEKKDTEDTRNEENDVPNTKEPGVNQEKDSNVNSTNNIKIISPTDNAAGIENNIFRYLKGQPKLGLCYPKDSPFDLVAYTDSDYAGASLDKKSTTGGCQFLGLYTTDDWNEVKQLLRMELRLTLATTKDKNINREAQIHTKVDGKKVIISEATIRRDLKFEYEGGIDFL
nr:uncharacterized mitochondrial protein AtMg00810-like [Tanacetum cinerariifolium]